MKKNIRRFIATVMTVALLLTAAPLNGFVGLKLNLDWLNFSEKASALSSSGSCGENVSYTFDSTTGLLTISGSGAMYGYDWGDSPFFYNSSIKTVVIENGVTSIGNFAFYNCTGLTSITIPDSVASIGDSAFYNTTYYSNAENWENDVLYIGNHLIKAKTSISGSYKVKDKTKTIADFAFDGCTGLTSVTIGNGVTSIGSWAFGDCIGLKELTMPCSAKIYNSEYTFYDCTNIEKVTLTKGTGTMQTYGTSTSSSSSYTYYGYTPWYLSRNSVKEIIIEDGVTNIGNYAFYNCTGLTNITIPDSVTSIGNSAFYGCTGLTKVNIKSIEAWCKISFNGYGSNPLYYAHNLYLNNEIVTDLVIPDSVTSIGNYAFSGCTGLTSVTIGNGVTSIGDDAFYSETVLYVGVESCAEKYAESHSNYYVVINPSGEAVDVTVNNRLSFNVDKANNLLTIKCDGKMPSFQNQSPPWAEYQHYYDKVIIENGCENIDQYAFKGCKSITNISIPDSVTSIGEYAFYNCACLKNVIIPSNVTSIGRYTFYGCTNLTSVTIPSGVTSIGDYTFYDCTSLANATIPEGVTGIGGYTFYDCVSLTSIIIPDSVTSIGGHAFYGCKSLTNIAIPDKVTSISEYTFYGCSALKELTMPCSAKIYNSSYTFSGCSNIEKVTFTKGTGTMQTYGTSTSSSATYTNYGYTPWYISRNSIKEIVIEDGVKNIGSYAFNGCTSLTSVTIADSVTSIGSYAFRGCTGLTEIVFPISVNSIGSDAFTGCSNLLSIKIYNRSCNISSNDFSIYSTIYGHKDSTAEAFADEHGLGFQLIPEGDHEHVYSNACDAECNICGYTRITSHTFDNDCDSDCNVCGYTRVPTHTDTDNNGICDVCGKTISDIIVGEQKNVEVSAGKTVYLKFIPATAGIYTFYSSSSSDTFGYICDGDMVQFASDDDGGSGSNFSITATLSEGKVYYLGLRFYNSDASGTIPVTIRLDQVICEHKVYHAEHKDATCTENGYDKVICDRCKEVLSTTIIPINHDYVWITILNPTTEHTGKAVKKCSQCGDIIDEFIIPALIPDFVTGITLSADKLALSIGETADIIATVTPDTAKNKNVIWTTSDSSIVSVADGVVTAKAPGVAVVYAKTEDGGYKDFCIVRVASLVSANGSIIDNESGMIYGLSANTKNIKDFVNLVDDTMTVTCNTSEVGTGSIISIEKDGKVVDTFTAVVFGDVNGDSWYDGTDAVVVSLIANGMLTREQVGEAVYMAADCNHDGTIDEFDVEILQQAGLLLANVDQSKSKEELQTDSNYVEYLNLIDQNPTEDEPTSETSFFQWFINFIVKIFSFIKNIV